MRRIFIYCLMRPVSPKEVKYVGKTVNVKDRYYKHLHYAKNGGKRHVSNWINKLLKENLLPELLILEICDETSWIKREQYWIEFYESNLCNHSKGGEGAGLGHKNCVGRKYSDATKLKMSISQRKRVKYNNDAFMEYIKTRDNTGGKNGNAKKVLHIDSGKTFDSLKEGCTHLNLKYNTQVSAILKRLKTAKFKPM